MTDTAPKRGGARKLLARIGAMLMGLLVAVLLIEVGLRVLYTRLPPALQISLRFVHVHPFTEERLAPLPLWQTDRDYQTIVQPGARDLLQIGSLSARFHVSTYNWWGGRVGFRSPQPETGGFDAVAIGDSHTFCFVELADCWVTLLGAQANLNLVNMGQPVTGSVSHERLYNDFVAKPALNLRQPKLVIWQFFGNDFNDDYALAQLNGTNKTPPPTDLPAQGAASYAPGTLARWLSENSALYALIDAMRQGATSTASSFTGQHALTVGSSTLWFDDLYTATAHDMTLARNLEGEELSQGAILRTRRLVEQNGGTFVLLLMPAKEEVYRDRVESIIGKAGVDAIAAPRTRMLAFCKAQGLICFDPLGALKDAARSDVLVYYGDDTHLNAAGNRVLAEALAEFLQTQAITK